MIDFEGYKYLLITLNNEYKACFTNLIEVVPGGHIATDFEGDRRLYDNKYFTLHTNPDYKENEMKSDRLAYEIMEKGKESVYTQEMKDNSEVPVVGMMVLSRGEALEVISVYHIADAKVLTLFNSKTSGVRALYFKTAEVINIDVIDQHTDSEKAIDDLVLQINRVQYDANMSDMALKDIIAVAFEAGISFTGDKK